MEILIFFIAWIAFGVIGGIMMSNKGRSGCGGFALGFLLGPIGLLIALVMNESAEHRVERIETEEQIRQAARRQQDDEPESEAEMRARIRHEEQIRAEERQRIEEELRREREREDD